MRRFLIISLLAGIGLMPLSAARADDLQVQENAPDRYTVVKGDTLWDISGRFLKQPWRWPEIWRLNKEEIKDPHWIYPGDVIVLDRSTQPPRLRIEGRGAPGEGGSALGSAQDGSGAGDRVRLSPGVQKLSREQAIPSIPLHDIQAFMGHPLVVEARDVDTQPKISAFDGHRTLGTAGDSLFVRGALPPGVSVFQVYRPGSALVNPRTKEILAYRADYVGDVRLSELGAVSRFTILPGGREMQAGDRLMKPESSSEVSFVPRAPASPVNGYLISTDDKRTLAARHEVVAISLGKQDGLFPGNVLAVYPSHDETDYVEKNSLDLPETRSGLLFVFRTFDRVSYALVVQSQRALNVPDLVRNP